jgi:hypothetical protein
MGFASSPYKIETGTNQRNTALLINGIHDGTFELALSCMGWIARHGGGLASSDGSPRNQTNRRGRMAKALEVPLLGLSFDLVK